MITPLLRFSCFKRKDSQEDWEEITDSSYCTLLPVETPMPNLSAAATIILEAVKDVNYKKRLEELSWLCMEDFDV